MAIRIHVLRNLRELNASIGRAAARTGCSGAWYCASTTNCTAGEEIGYPLSNRNFNANFSSCEHNEHARTPPLTRVAHLVYTFTQDLQTHDPRLEVISLEQLYS